MCLVKKVECKKIAIALTGASGIRYGLRLVEALSSIEKVEIAGIMYTENALKVAEVEGIKKGNFLKLLKNYGKVYDENDYDSPLASSSSIPDCMIICPASIKTIGLIANGIPLNLISRAGLAFLRMKRPLAVAFRETPLGSAEIENLLRLSKLGAIILPLSPGFYSKPKSIEDLVDFMVGKILDSLHISNNLYKRWSAEIP